ncbi:MAG: efflux RND transporter permease subunit, partial [Clostridia bacterium]|nr:efflux RND transporter permease subunit [Clostridia bacterium]
AYKQSKSAVANFEEQLTAIDNDATLTDEEKVAKKEEVTASPAYVTAVATHESNKAAIATLGVSPEGVDQAIIEKQFTIAELEGSLFLLEESLEGLGTSLDDLDNTIQETENSLQQIKDGEKAIEEGIAQIDSGMMQLEAAAALLSAQKASGLLELASASAEIASNSAALTAGMTQIEAGFDTIEANRETALDQADLNEILTLEMLTGILTAQNFSMPAGYITEEGVSYMVSVGDPIATEKELSNLLLFDMGMEGVDPVRLSDVAEIFRTDNAADTYAKLGIQDSLMLTFEKQSNYATAQVTDNIEARFDELEDEYDGLRFVSLMNQGDYIYLIVESILKSLGLGALFSVIILFIFLKDLRPTVITLCSIPISVIFAIVLMYFSGVTLNMISLSGLAVSVGMLVDNSVVVIENIYRLRAKGVSAIKSAASGAAQVAGAVTASTLTTVCVFLPIVFVEGITKQLFTDLALTMGYSLMASLIVSLTLVPAMASGMLKKDKQTKDYVLPIMLRGYQKALRWSLKHKAIVLIASLVLLAGSAALVLVRGFSFMPTVEMPSVTATLAMPEDVTMEEAVEYADTVLERMEDMDEIDTVGAMMSATSDGLNLTSLMSAGSGKFDVTMYINLKNEQPATPAITAKIEALTEGLPCTLSVSSSMMDISMLTGSGVSVNLYSNDQEALMNAAAILADAMDDIEGVKEVSNGLEDTVPAIHIAVDRNKAMSKGITVAQIFMELSGVLPESTTGSSMTLDGETLGIILEKQEEKVLELSDLEDYTFTVTKQDGTTAEFPLSDVATIEETTSLPSLSRANQRRLMTVAATLEDGYNVTLVSSDVEDVLSGLDLGSGVSYEISGENEAIMEAIEQLLLMLLLGIILVYLVMVAQFQSLKAPFIVLFTIPLAFTGGFLALWIAGMELSVIGLIGFIMLVGIIVNNGIVLVDYVNQLRLEGLPMQEAIVEAGVTRMRPILMTSITTILGLFDMAFGKGLGTSLTAPMALVCIGGLTYATTMTLFIIPCIYAITSKKELRKVDEAELVTVDF